jgi:hypothetical protein
MGEATFAEIKAEFEKHVEAGNPCAPLEHKRDLVGHFKKASNISCVICVVMIIAG